MLRDYDPYPYANARPLIDKGRLLSFCNALRRIGWKFGIISWLSQETTPEYDEQVVAAKLSWIDRNFTLVDEIAIVDYGVAKHEIVAPREAILIDDEAQNRMHWDASGPLRRSY
ncbi:MAG: hypothetical protein BZ138_08325, partial [Methanosphaera sp. rholeuAM270]